MYGTAAGYEAYHLERDNDIPADSAEDEINAALLVASEWIDAIYGLQFPGLKVGMRSQVREWPRTGAYDRYGYVVASDAVPREIEQATYEAAWRQLVSPGSLTLDYTPGKYKRASVDGAVSVEFANFSSAADFQKQFPIIDRIISPLLVGAGGYSPLTGDAVRV